MHKSHYAKIRLLASVMILMVVASTFLPAVVAAKGGPHGEAPGLAKKAAEEQVAETSEDIQASEESAAEEPVAEEAAVGQGAFAEETALEEPAPEESVAEEEAAAEAVVEEPAVQEPAVDEAGAEAGAEDLAVGQLAAEEPAETPEDIQAGEQLSAAGSGSGLASGFGAGSAKSAESDTTPTVTTDKHKYYPGETVEISGTGMDANEIVAVEVFEGELKNPKKILLQSRDVHADPDGKFSDSYTLPLDSKAGTYTIVATGNSSGKTATARFVDPPATNWTLEGYKITTAGSDKISTGWIGGNLGNTWQEGEWVAYKLTVTNLQTNCAGFSCLVGNPIIISGDFTKGGARFVDLMRGFQVASGDLDDSQGYPGFPIVDGTTDLIPVNAAQNSPYDATDGGDIRLWSGPAGGDADTWHFFTPDAVNEVFPAGTETITDATHAWRLEKATLDAACASCGAADTITIYFQFHLSRTFIWSNGLQEGYDASPTDDSGGDLYSTGSFPSDMRNGSGFVSGSSGHAHVETNGLGSADVPIPVPPEPAGVVSGLKWRDDNGNGVQDGGEPALSGWGVHISGIVENITFTQNLLTDGSGNYSFPNLTAATPWLVTEDEDRTTPPETIYSQTYPTLASSLANPAATATSTAGGTLAPVGWNVQLTASAPVRTGADFGNKIPQGDIELQKDFVGTAENVTLKIGTTPGASDVDSAALSADGTTGENIVSPGTFFVSETLTTPANYIVQLACFDDTNDDGSVAGEPSHSVNTGTGEVSAASEDDVICVFTNTRKQGSIELKKVWNGTAGTTTLKIGTSAGASDIDSQLLSGVDGTTGANAVDTGTFYVSETDPGSNYDTTLSCEDGGGSVSVGLDGSVDVAESQDVVCTFTNSRLPTLTLQKTVINDEGGTATEDDFQAQIDGGNVNWDEAQTLDPGTYTASEIQNVTGYTESGWGGDCAADGSITLNYGEEAVCTITNDDIGPTLRLVKDPTNDNGGTAGPDDWDLTATATDDNSRDFTDAGDSVIFHSVFANDGYALSESSVPGYTEGSWSCDGGSLVGSTVTLDLDEDVTCTITNDDEQAFITVIKEVINDNGGSALPNDFDLTLDASPVSSGVAVAVDPGTYTAGETLLPGYTFLGFSGDCDSGGNVTVALGESKTCTLTNDDQQAFVTVEKVVNNTHGGTALPNDFDLTLDSSPVSSGVAVPVDPGTHTAGETLLPGYEFDGFSGDCDSGGNVTVALGESKTCTLTNSDLTGHLIVHKVTLPADDPNVFSITLSDAPASGSVARDLSTAASVDYEVDAGTYSVTEGAEPGWDETGNTCVNVVVANGETEECTITNTQRAHIIVEKDAVLDSSQEFTFHNDFGNGNPATFGLTDDSTPGFASFDAEVLPGTYAVSEDPVSGWKSPKTATCDNGDDPSAVSVGPGETVTCTFTNQKLATITLVKETVGGDGTFDFVMTGDTLNPSAQLTTVGGTAEQTFLDIDPDNTYSIEETPIPAGWALTGSECSGTNTPGSITPNSGEEITCTFFNRKPAAQIDLDPLEATNAVDENHEITATVQVHDGDAAWEPASEGTLVTFSLADNFAAASFVGGSTCLTSSGSCSVTITASSTGTVDIHAETSPEVLGVTVDVETDGLLDNSGDAEKLYVNARISIVPSGTNEVGNEHVFTVTVEEDTGSGFTGVQGVFPTVDVAPPADTIVDNCAGTGTDTDGECTVVINSDTADTFTATASLDLVVEGVLFNLVTNGENGNSEPAVKNYVDAQILISADGTNEVDEEHIFTVTVNKDLGDGAGFVPAEGETVSTSITGTGSLTGAGSCETGTTDGDGECTIIAASAAAGIGTVHASVTVAIDTESLFRETGDGVSGDSEDARKTWVDGRIVLTPEDATNDIESPHSIVAHVFENDGTGETDASGVQVDFSLLNNTAGAAFTGANFCVTDGTGACAVEINSSTPGNADIHATAAWLVSGVSITRASDGTHGSSEDAGKEYVAGALKITKIVELGGVVNPSAVSEDFTVTVTGPSHPAGTDIVFSVVSGVLQDPTMVTLEPLIPGDYTVAEADAGSEWLQVVATSPVQVVANETAQVQVTNTFVPGSLEMAKAIELGDYPFDVNTSFTVTVTGASYPGGTDLTFNVVNGVVVNSPQTLNNLIPGVYAFEETDPGAAWSVTNMSGDVTVNPDETAARTVTNTLNQPHTTISIAPDVFETSIGGNVMLTIVDTNDGAVPLTNPHVELMYDLTLITLDKASPHFVSGDTDGDGVMDVGESWIWVVQVTILVDTTFTAEGHGLDPLGNDITPENGFLTEADEVTVKTVGATRTQGFWKTHLAFTTHVFENLLGSFIDLGYTQVDSMSDLMGIFWANNAKKSDGSKRTPLEQARVTAAKQALAAILNSALPNGEPLPVSLADIADILAGTDIGAIKALGSTLDAYNNSGDDIALDASLPPTGKAEPQEAKDIADIPFAD